MQLTIEHIKHILNADYYPQNSNLLDLLVDGYSIDTRILTQEEVFIALSHNQSTNITNIHHAIQQGIKLIIINQLCFDLINTTHTDLLNVSNIIYLIVPDIKEAINKLASTIRQQFKQPIIGITGSVGKTTLKDFLAYLISCYGTVSKTLGNFNNNIGLPISLINLHHDSIAGIYEMGMSAIGEINYLTQITQPNIAIITQISAAHLEFFQDLKHIAYAKAEIMNHMLPHSSIFLNKDDQFFNLLHDIAISKSLQVLSFTQSNTDADIVLNTHNNQYIANIFNHELIIPCKHLAPHNVLLTTIALGVIKHLGFDLNMITSSTLSSITVPTGRGNVEHYCYNNVQFTIINDSYNANSISMQESLKHFKQHPNPQKIIILGEMLELGDNAEQYHHDLLPTLQTIKYQQLILVGKLMHNISKKLNCIYFNNHHDALAYLINHLTNNDIILIKGSYGSNVHQIVEYFNQQDTEK